MVPKAVLYIIIGLGALQFSIMCGLAYLVMHSANETEKNRRIACVGRFLDGEQYSPECERYIVRYKEGIRNG